MRIAYLDQNKWIDLARAAKHAADYPELYAILKVLAEEVGAGHLALPLTFANIYETHKINDPRRRHDLASVQAALSGGLVFRGRHKRLEIEISDFLQHTHGLPATDREPNWFLSDVFFEAVAESNDQRLGFTVSDKVRSYVRRYPAYTLYDYLMCTPDDLRTSSVRQFSGGADQLRQRIEARRRRDANESLSLRRRAYSAMLIVDEVELIMQIARMSGIAWTTVGDIQDSDIRCMVDNVPTYYVEREIALRLEAQNRQIDENDFRDMQSFCAVLAYADDVIAENQFIGLAKQAKLDKKYNTRIATDIAILGDATKSSISPEKSARG